MTMPFRSRTTLRRLAVLFVALLLTGCASTFHYPINPPLKAIQAEYGYRADAMFRHPGDESLFIVLAFSGGGSRAAAMAFGVLEELANQQIFWRGEQKRLIDEVDMVTAVSGGSITAAYWALAGDRIFKDFAPQFLEQDLQTRLIDRVTSINNLWRTTSPRFGRGDLLAEELDDALFHGATFGDLIARDKAPLTLINATELSTGARFEFIQESFDALCSDLSAFPISRAVAASSAVPFLFSPITLWNRAGDCGPSGDLLTSISPDERQSIKGTRLETRLQQINQLRDRTLLPNVHLIDGGVSDNLALRALLDLSDAFQLPVVQQSSKARHLQVQRVVVISVDAGTDNNRDIAASADVPRMLQVAHSLSDIIIAHGSEDTRFLVRDMFRSWRTQAAAQHGDDIDAAFYFVPVSLRLLPDERERGELLTIPTTLFLPSTQVTRLRRAAAQVLHQSKDYQRLVQELSPPISGSP